MRLANCKTVCREIDELNVDQNLSTFASEHLLGCERCQTFYDGRRNLRTLLAGLEPVEAPADFDFRVRARLASGEAERHSGFFGSRSFGMPAAALATLVFLLAAGFALRTLTPSDNGTTAGGTQTTVDQPSKVDQASTSNKQETVAQNDDRTDDAVTPPDTVSTTNGKGQRKERYRITQGIAPSRPGNRMATQEFSIEPAQVVKKDDAVASLETFPVFTVEASVEPLKVSLDYETGVSRTISLPTLSFGSQRALVPSGATVKTSSKVW